MSLKYIANLSTVTPIFSTSFAHPDNDNLEVSYVLEHAMGTCVKKTGEAIVAIRYYATVTLALRHPTLSEPFVVVTNRSRGTASIDSALSDATLQSIQAFNESHTVVDLLDDDAISSSTIYQVVNVLPVINSDFRTQMMPDFLRHIGCASI